MGGALICIQALRPHFAGRGFGRVVTIGTNLVHNPVVPYHDYTAAKGALLAFTRTAAKELGPLGVTVNMVSGGLLRTTDASRATPEAVFDIVAAQTPLGRVTTPEDMADAVLFFYIPLGAGGHRAEPHRRWWSGVRLTVKAQRGQLQRRQERPLRAVSSDFADAGS